MPSLHENRLANQYREMHTSHLRAISVAVRDEGLLTFARCDHCGQCMRRQRKIRTFRPNTSSRTATGLLSSPDCHTRESLASRGVSDHAGLGWADVSG